MTERRGLMALPYLLQGVMPVKTESSVLVSSSKYLNDPRLRDWIAMIAFRKNGPDFPPPAEMHALPGILDELRDHDHIEAMFTAERKVNPALDRWFNEGFISAYTIDDFKDYAPGTVGGIFHEWITQGNYGIQIVPWTKPETQLQFYNMRSGQTHDFEHILCGGGFNSMGELVPYWYRLTNVFKHIRNPELAGELSVLQLLGSLRYTIRTMLHYPQVWEVTVDAMQRGMRVGQQSDALFMAKIEDVFHLPVEEARTVLGVRGAEDRDTSAEGEFFLDRAA
jgi:ubiquinone biosynthesis protein Coq4